MPVKASQTGSADHLWNRDTTFSTDPLQLLLRSLKLSNALKCLLPGIGINWKRGEV